MSNSISNSFERNGRLLAVANWRADGEAEMVFDGIPMAYAAFRS
ncbi:hypothetical protein [Trinickia soli]|nr:hypothetical protein [Trinickia soli]CAB3714056.1 hypothetical protein LMG24076_04172 [Trinickia soli]